MLLDAAALSPSSALDDPVSAAVSSELQARCYLTEHLRLSAASSVAAGRKHANASACCVAAHVLGCWEQGMELLSGFAQPVQA